MHGHVEPIERKDRSRDEILEHHQNFGEKILKIKSCVEVIYIHRVMRFCHVSEDGEHNCNNISH